MANLGSLVYQVKADTSDLRQAERRVKQSSQQMSSSMAGVGKALAASFAGVSIASLVRDIVESGMQIKRLDQAFRAITGSASGSKKELEFLRTTADKLGQDFLSVAEGYKTIAAAAKDTSLEGKGVRDIFMAIMNAGTRLQLSNDQVQGSLYAISQMISKGTVSSEELRQQLGERLPGAFQIAARAMGVTTQQLGKMLEQGQVIADEFLPKFARELDKAGGEAVNAAAPFNRLANEWRDLKASLEKGIVGEIVIKGADKITYLLQMANKQMKEFNEPDKTPGMTGDDWWSTTEARMKEFNRVLREEGYFETSDIMKMGDILMRAADAAAKVGQQYRGIKGELEAIAKLLPDPSFGKFREMESKGVAQQTAKEKSYWSTYYEGMSKAATKLKTDLLTAEQEYNKILSERKAMLEHGDITKAEFDEAKKQLDIKYKLEPNLSLKQAELELYRAQTQQMQEQALLQGKIVTGADSNLQALANWAADYYGISRNLVSALVTVESGWKTGAVSPKGAMGLTQLMPGTAKDEGVTNAFDPFQNLFGGVGYLKKMIDKFGSVQKALAAYNTGPWTVQTKGITGAGQEYINLIEGAMGGGTALQQAQKASQIRTQGLEKEKQLLLEIMQLEIQKAQDSGATAEEINAIRTKYQAEILGYETEISKVGRESAEEQKQLTQEKLQAEIAAFEMILQSGTLTQEQYQKVYEEYHQRRLALIKLEEQAAIKAGVSESLAREQALKKEEELRKQRQAKDVKGAMEIAQVAQEYARLAGSHQQVYEAEMMMIAAKMKELELNKQLDIPGLAEAYKALYAEQMRVADVMAHGGFGAGFMEGLRDIAKEMKTVGELGRDVAKTLASSFGTFISDVVSGTKSIKEAFRDMVNDLIKKFADMFAENLIQQIASAITGGGKGAGGGGGGGFLSSIFGGGGGGKAGGLAGLLGGAATGVATMNVTAGVVNLTGAGAGAGGITDLLGAGGGGGGSGGT